MKKYINKQTIVAFLLGAILFSIAPVSAAIEEFICYRADYKLVINGVEFNDPDIPLMNYKGYTVGSVRKILEAVGIPITWNAELSQAEVTLNPTSAQINNVEGNNMSTATTIQFDPVTGLPVGAEYIENEKDGHSYKTISYNGKIYISTADLEKVFGIKSISIDVKNQTQNFSYNGKTISVDVNSALFIKAYAYYDISQFQI